MSKLLMFALISKADAGWLKSFCQSFVAEDPYQFETASESWLRRELERLKIQATWNKADRHDLSLIKIIERELADREVYVEAHQ